MRELSSLMEFLDTLTGKVSMGFGTFGLTVLGIFKINTEIDKRIDKRSTRIVDKAVAIQHEECTIKYTEDMATMKNDISWIKDSLDRLEKK